MKINGHQFLNNQEVINELAREFNNRFHGNENEYINNFLLDVNTIFEKFGFPEIKSIEQQKRVGSRIIDIFIVHKDLSCSVLEVKCKKEKISLDEQFKSIGQILMYDDIFQHQYKVAPRLFLVDQKIYIDTWKIILRNKLPINLLQFQYDNVVLIGSPK